MRSASSSYPPIAIVALHARDNALLLDLGQKKEVQDRPPGGADERAAPGLCSPSHEVSHSAGDRERAPLAEDIDQEGLLVHVDDVGNHDQRRLRRGVRERLLWVAQVGQEMNEVSRCPPPAPSRSLEITPRCAMHSDSAPMQSWSEWAPRQGPRWTSPRLWHVRTCLRWDPAAGTSAG